MDPNHRIDDITTDTIHNILTEYPSIIADKLHALDKARYETIPTALAARDDPFLTKPEVATLVDWKLSHGTFRPTLKKLVDQNSDDDITSISRDAFAAFAKDPYNNIKSSLTTLTQLKGIGPATASLLLSVCDPARAPFFSDELFQWAFWEDKKGCGWDRKIKYTPKEYLELFERIQELQTRLGDVRAVDLEKVAYVLGKPVVGKSGKSGQEVEEKTGSTTKEPDLKRKAEDEVVSGLKDIQEAKKAKASKNFAQQKEPARATRQSMRLNGRNSRWSRHSI